LKAGVLDIRVVAGYRVEDLLTAVKPLPVKVIFNPLFDRGMYSSVQVAVGSLEPEIEAFFLFHRNRYTRQAFSLPLQQKGELYGADGKGIIVGNAKIVLINCKCRLAVNRLN